jgi:hypothetical protein
VVLVAAGLARLVMPYSAGNGTEADERTCFALRDGWSRPPTPPTEAEWREAREHVNQPLPRSRAEALAMMPDDIAFRRSRAWARVNALADWERDGGVCVAEGRDALELSGALLGGAVLGWIVLGIVTSRSRPDSNDDAQGCVPRTGAAHTTP